VVVNRNVGVPPVPQLIAIRPAQHPESGYDRIAFDINGALPGYDIRYVTRPVAGGSGAPVNVPGSRYLQITFKPAQAHDDAGNSLVPRSQTLNYPMMKAYAITQDFEGVLTVVLGLGAQVGFRVGELPGQPGRIYVDVAA
jgi:hypothetical protein